MQQVKGPGKINDVRSHWIWQQFFVVIWLFIQFHSGFSGNPINDRQ